MRYNPQKHHRRSIRLKGYDYSNPGAYFITICVNKRLCLFGEIYEGKMILNDAGKMVTQIWNEIPHHYPYVDIDQHTVMPNHFHGIIILLDSVGASPRGRPGGVGHSGQTRGPGQAQGPDPTRGFDPPKKRLTLGEVVGRFETFTMHKYIHGVKNIGWEPFYKKLWQRNYYEHIIRNNRDLNRIRKHIIENPTNWEQDNDNPKKLGYDGRH